MFEVVIVVYHEDHTKYPHANTEC